MMTVMDLAWSTALGGGLLALGFAWGRRSKLRELHKLQDEGYLSITYLGHHPHGVQGKDIGPTIHELLHEQPEQPAIEPELQRVRYPRRDRDGERRDDWAMAMKARSLRARERAQGNEPPDHEDEPE